MHRLRDESDAFDIPLTPLIDVVFLLLIFFLVATNFTRKEVDQKVKLPRAEGGARNTGMPRNLVVNIRRDGTLVINGRVHEYDALRETVRQWRAESPEGRVAVRCDGRASWKRIARVLGACHAAGVENVDLPVMPDGDS